MSRPAVSHRYRQGWKHPPSPKSVVFHNMSTSSPSGPFSSPLQESSLSPNRPPPSPSPSLALPLLSPPPKLTRHSSAPPLQLIQDNHGAAITPLRSFHLGDSNRSFENSLQADIQASAWAYGETHVHTARLYLQLGNTEFRRGRWTAAAVAYDQARKCPAERTVAQLNAATVCWRQGHVRGAIQLLRGIASEPQVEASACHQMGLCFALLGQSDTALQWLLRAKKAQQGDPVAVARTLDTMGQVRSRDERWPEAVRLHRKALGLLLEDGTRSPTRTLDHLARAYDALGQADTAQWMVAHVWKLQKETCSPWMNETKDMLDRFRPLRKRRTRTT